MKKAGRGNLMLKEVMTSSTGEGKLLQTELQQQCTTLKKGSLELQIPLENTCKCSPLSSSTPEPLTISLVWRGCYRTHCKCLEFKQEG